MFGDNRMSVVDKLCDMMVVGNNIVEELWLPLERLK
jgi:hypothetical protein